MVQREPTTSAAPGGSSPAASSPAASSPAATSTSATGTIHGRRTLTGRLSWRPSVPPQHGAWAFLIVPVLCGFAVAGTSAAGWAFLVAWVLAFPVGYYTGRAVTTRFRRGSWTRLARRELGRAAPWAGALAAVGLPLAFTRPWLVPTAAVLAVLWGIGLSVAARRGERSMANDLLLVAQAAAAVPLSVAVVAGPEALVGTLAAATACTTAVVLAYLIGSVVHVKSLIREASNASYRRFNVGWHSFAALGAAVLSPWWLVGMAPALVRSVVMRPGLRPGAIGGIEAVVAVLVVVAAIVAV